ncbi:helix-turn-helix transcriptional regulator [Saccharopolyspora sp. NPDC047091]|uniref:helix-turn-helix domain-containing protein n=1 Tax=Saccharopolyspora sp. NPDC047091 TaxID=3155924 RepID=UPI003407BBC2
MDGDNPLGEFLRARRAQVRPEDWNLPAVGRRRVAGLRREELASLAGVSSDYYVRLEQGRERNPSPQVIDALATVLHLDAEATTHLHRLTRPGTVRRPSRSERVSPNLLRLLESWPGTPAVVLDRYYTVLADNELGAALYGGHTYSGDLVRMVFLDADAHRFFLDWERIAENTVAGLHAAAALDRDDPRLVELVGELSLHSAEFRRLWARHDVRRKAHESKRFFHPQVGEMALSYETFSVHSAPGQQLMVYRAEPGSPSAEALALLGSLNAPAATRSTPDSSRHHG